MRFFVMESDPLSDRTSPFRRAIIRCAKLASAMACVWFVIAVASEGGLTGRASLQAGFASLLCLVPGWLVFLLVAGYRVPNSGLLVMLAGTGLRMVFAGGGVLYVKSLQPEMWTTSFPLFVVLCYLVALVVETGFVIGESAQAGHTLTEGSAAVE